MNSVWKVNMRHCVYYAVHNSNISKQLHLRPVKGHVRNIATRTHSWVKDMGLRKLTVHKQAHNLYNVSIIVSRFHKEQRKYKECDCNILYSKTMLKCLVYIYNVYTLNIPLHYI
jgi:hypothetical protein